MRLRLTLLEDPRGLATARARLFGNEVFLFVDFFVQPITFHFSGKRSHAYPAGLGGEADVSTEIFELTGEIILFHLPQPLSKRSRARDRIFVLVWRRRHLWQFDFLDNPAGR